MGDLTPYSLPVLCVLILGGCGGPDEVYKRETFEVDSPYQLLTTLPQDSACESARRALLGQGYIIDSADAGAVKGRKAFRVSGDESTVLEMNVVCVARGEASTIFANAVESVYTVKKSAQSASVGVPVIGSISVPLSGSSDSLVKIGDATVNDKEFYQRFFTVIEYYLEQVAATGTSDHRESPDVPASPSGPSTTPRTGSEAPAAEVQPAEPPAPTSPPLSAPAPAPESAPSSTPPDALPVRPSSRRPLSI
jgi:hypothetical protein